MESDYVNTALDRSTVPLSKKNVQIFMSSAPISVRQYEAMIGNL